MDQNTPGNFTNTPLDLVMRDSDFVLYNGTAPVLTPKGNEFSHSDSRLLKHILVMHSMPETAEPYPDFGFFAFYRDFPSIEGDFLEKDFTSLVSADPLAGYMLNPQQKRGIFNPAILMDLEDDNRLLNLMVLGASVIVKGLKDLFSGIDLSGQGDQQAAALAGFLLQQYQDMAPEKRAMVALLAGCHSNGFVLPLLLVAARISPSEYALASLAVHSNDSDGFFPPVGTGDYIEGYISRITVNWKQPFATFGSFLGAATATRRFLGYFMDGMQKMSVLSEIISRGENDSVEFKSTFRWDIRQNKKNPAIEHAALKSMAAFLNSEGGDLLLGVADDGSIVGIETDGFANDDKFLLHVWMLIKSSMGQDISPFIKTTLEKIDGKTVCRVQCLRSPKPVFLRQSGFDEMFYIRIGPSSGNLEISEALKYISNRF